MYRFRQFFVSGFHRLFLILFIGVFTASLVLIFRLDQGNGRLSSEIYSPAQLQGLDVEHSAVKIGIFVNRLHNVDLSAGSFSANGYLWMNWGDAAKARWRDGHSDDQIESMGVDGSTIDLQPLDIGVVELMNKVSGSGQRKVVTERPVRFLNGRMWQEIKFASDFLMHKIDYRQFPFETIYLPIEVGSDFPVKELVFVPDHRDSLVSDRVDLSGYRFEGLKAKNLFYQAKTNWGHEVSPEESHAGNHNAYPQLEWELHFRRAIGSSFVRLFLPLVSAMAALLFALAANFKLAAQKVSIPASILLVLAVLQDRWHSLLPPGLPYLTYMDKLFIFAYFITVIVFAHSVYCVNRYHCSEDVDQPKLMIQMRHQQRILSSAISVALLVAPFVLWFV